MRGRCGHRAHGSGLLAVAGARIFFITLMAALVFAGCVCTQGTSVRDADGGPARTQGETKGLEGGKDRGEKNPGMEKGEGSVSKEREEKTKEPSPKKPRLKYWDPYECGC